MKKNFLLLVSLFLCAVGMMAGPVDQDGAKRIAASYLGKEVVASDVPASAKIRKAVKGTSASAPAFHIFNAEDGNGYVIVSGESAMPQIVAYSDEGVFNAANMHPSLEAMLENYAFLVDDVRQGRVEAEAIRAPRKAKAVVAPLCDCSWGQDAPYNTLCPAINGTKCPVGCVATAMAQIMYHFQWPKVGIGKNQFASGISGVGVISSDFSQHEYNWQAMGKTQADNLSSEEAAAAVAQLSYDCGIATRMNYALDGSGTNDDLAMKALYTYFGYKASKLDFQRRDCYATQEEWDDLVKSYLNAGSPVLYGGYARAGGGHEFIIDGYDVEGNFHVNWGWDGSSNGYYSIVTLAPSRTNMSFSMNQSMVCGFEPDVEGNDKTPRQWRIYMLEAPSVQGESANLGDAFTFNTNLFYNYTRSAFTWTCGVALYDKEGNQVKLLSSAKRKDYTYQILSYYGRTGQSLSATIPLGTPDGDYTLRSVFRQEGYSDFILPDMVGGTQLNAIPVMIENGVAYFNQVSLGVDEVAAAARASVSYFNLQGRKLSRLAPGEIVIKRTMLSDGTVRSEKMLVK